MGILASWPSSDSSSHPTPSSILLPETTTLYRIVQGHLESYLALASEANPVRNGVLAHVEADSRHRSGAVHEMRDLLRSLPPALRGGDEDLRRRAGSGSAAAPANNRILFVARRY